MKRLVIFCITCFIFIYLTAFDLKGRWRCDEYSDGPVFYEFDGFGTFIFEPEVAAELNNIEALSGKYECSDLGMLILITEKYLEIEQPEVYYDYAGNKWKVKNNAGRGHVLSEYIKSECEIEILDDTIYIWGAKFYKIK